MKTASVILLSWALTLLLMGFNFSLYQTRTFSPKPKMEGFKNLTNTVKRVVRYRPTPPPPPPPPPPFTWAQLESDEYAKYIINLRGVGCPETTIRDIVLADLEKYYEEREELLEAERDRNFWRTGAQIERDERAYARKTIELAREKRALIKQLLNVEVDAGSLKLWQEEDVAAWLTGFMADPKPERAVACYTRGTHEAKALRDMIGEIVTPEDEAAQEKLYKTLRGELAQIMTGPELEELECRVAVVDGLKLQGVDMTGDELRRYALLLAQAGEPLREVFELEREQSEEEKLVAEAKVTAEVQKLLGPARFIDFQRAQDDRFQEVFSLTEENQLPKTTAIKLYEIRQAVDVQMEQARENPELTDEERLLLLGALRVQTERAFARYLGPNIFAEYQKQKLGDKWFEGTSLDGPKPTAIQTVK